MSKNRIGIACAFRQHSDDGAFIPASRVVEGGPLDGRVAPLIGYLAAFDGQKVTWSFVKYEAPRVFPFWDGSKWGVDPSKPNQRGNIATCRVGTVHCPSCDGSVAFPIKGGKDGDHHAFCPVCGNKGVDVAVIKENSPEFTEMAGDLKDDLENAACSALKDGAPDFEFPLVVCGGPDLAPDDPLVPPQAQGLAQSHSRALKSLRSMAGLADLVNAGADDQVDLSILPGVYFGTRGADEVRDGLSWSVGAMSFYLRVRLPERKRCASFSCFRY